MHKHTLSKSLVLSLPLSLRLGVHSLLFPALVFSVSVVGFVFLSPRAHLHSIASNRQGDEANEERDLFKVSFG